MKVGDHVEVHTSYNDSWVPGFKVVKIVDEGYHICHTSDGTPLPGFTSESDLRAEPPERAW